MWDAATGAPIGQPLQHKGRLERGVQPRRRAGGDRLRRQDARVWDAATGAPIGRPLQHGAKLSATFSPDGARVVTASDDSRAGVGCGDRDADWPTLRHSVNSAAFSPDGTRVMTASDDRTARVWIAPPSRPTSSRPHARCSAATTTRPASSTRYGIDVKDPICTGNEPRPTLAA